MDSRSRNDSDIDCPFCGSKSMALVGESETRRMRQFKCRNCGKEYWENQMAGMLQAELDR